MATSIKNSFFLNLLTSILLISIIVIAIIYRYEKRQNIKIYLSNWKQIEYTYCNNKDVSNAYQYGKDPTRYVESRFSFQEILFKVWREDFQFGLSHLETGSSFKIFAFDSSYTNRFNFILDVINKHAVIDQLNQFKPVYKKRFVSDSLQSNYYTFDFFNYDYNEFVGNSEKKDVDSCVYQEIQILVSRLSPKHTISGILSLNLGTKVTLIKNYKYNYFIRNFTDATRKTHPTTINAYFDKPIGISLNIDNYTIIIPNAADYDDDYYPRKHSLKVKNSSNVVEYSTDILNPVEVMDLILISSNDKKHTLNFNVTNLELVSSNFPFTIRPPDTPFYVTHSSEVVNLSVTDPVGYIVFGNTKINLTRGDKIILNHDRLQIERTEIGELFISGLVKEIGLNNIKIKKTYWDCIPEYLKAIIIGYIISMVLTIAGYFAKE